VAAHRTTDLTIEIHSSLQGSLTAPVSQGEAPFRIGPHTEELQQERGRPCIEMHDPNIQAGLVIRTDRATSSLLGNGGLLEVQPDFVFLAPTIDTVSARLLGLSQAGQPGDAPPREGDVRWVKPQEHVARGYDDLPFAGLSLGQRQINRNLPVEQTQAYGTVVLAGYGYEDLTARAIRR
jgi:hypothetical protein